MKLIIISDIHGSYDNFNKLVPFIDRFKPDKIIILGDILNDYHNNEADDRLIDLLNRYSNIVGVKGNTDRDIDQNYLNFPMLNDYITFNIEDDIKIYCYHGHKYLNIPNNVIKVSGHTHTPLLNRYNINPGSITYPRGSMYKTFITYEDRLFTLYDLEFNIIDKISI